MNLKFYGWLLMNLPVFFMVFRAFQTGWIGEMWGWALGGIIWVIGTFLVFHHELAELYGLKNKQTKVKITNKIIPMLLMLPILFIAGCTSISDAQELKARNYCQDNFQAICNLVNKTCQKEGLAGCQNTDFNFIYSGNVSVLVRCFDDVCLHR